VSLSKLIKTARQSPHKFKHASVILRGGALIAAAYNTERKHAETRAIRKAKKPEGGTLINVRITKKGRFGMSFPCMACWKAIRKAGIEKVVYTDYSGEFRTVTT
jgi:pyrimidine deaminase RibD-like protein